MRVTSTLFLIVGLPVAAYAQSNTDSLSLAGRTNIMLGIGLTGARDASSTAGGLSSTHTTGEIGSFAFNHWVRPEIAVQISASVLNADASSIGGSDHTNAITPVLFGVSYSPRALALTNTIRPYISAAAGPYIHTVADATPDTATTTTESVAGARVALGANWFVARHFMMSLETDYHTVGRFEHRDAGTAKASGFGVSLGFGLVWGGKY